MASIFALNPAAAARANQHGPLRCHATAVETSPHAKLYTGQSIPLLGLGTWLPPGEAGPAVAEALDLGYRHLDCAQEYENQPEIGKVLKKRFDAGNAKGSTAGISREDVWITSKCFNDRHGEGKVQEACKQTLQEFGCIDYLDMYLVHWPVGNNKPDDPPLEETWHAMESLVDQGLTKAIGISNYSSKKVKDLLGYCRIKPALYQGECHPMWRNEAVFDLCQKEGIHFTAYSPLGRPDNMDALTKYDIPVILEAPEVLKIAQELKKEPAQVLLRWGIERGCSVVPKSTNHHHQKVNMDLMSWSLTKEQFNTLNTIKPQARYLSGEFFLNPKDGIYKTLDELWDGEISDANREAGTQSMKEMGLL